MLGIRQKFTNHPVPWRRTESLGSINERVVGAARPAYFSAPRVRRTQQIAEAFGGLAKRHFFQQCSALHFEMPQG
jgi:hypothetical protein